ncbi:MAG: RNA-binding domain-containing protein [Chloroflexota bacterium]
MTEVELLSLIAAGESETVEFKREMDRPERLARELVALANRQGGIVLIGVDDNRHVCGVTLPQDYEERIANVGAQTIDPPLPLTSHVATVQGIAVLAVHVPRGTHKPHCVREGQHRCIVYIRHGTTSRPATREEIGSLYQEGGILDFDLSPVPGATLADLNMDLIEQYVRGKLGKGLDELSTDLTQQLANWRILIEMAGERRVTLAGMLFFGDRPGDFLPQSRLWLKRFKGLATDVDEWHPGKEIDTPIPQAIEEAMGYIKSYTVVEEVRGLKRVQKTEYIEEVIREALVNAIAHRNYVRRGSRIHVSMFDDRIEVRNPGPLPNGVTVDNMRFGMQATRNPTIVRYLGANGYWEGDGLGVPRMIRLCQENGIREPDFALIEHDVVVSIYSRRYDEFH